MDEGFPDEQYHVELEGFDDVSFLVCVLYLQQPLNHWCA